MDSLEAKVTELKDKNLKADSTEAYNLTQNRNKKREIIMSNEMQEMAARASRSQQISTVVGEPGQHDETGLSETRSQGIVGPVKFTLSNLDVKGLGNVPADPANSQYIVAEDEFFVASVDVEFNKTPLTELLMCLGTRINIDFGLEGFGKKAAELNLSATTLTKKGVFKYSLKTTATRPIDQSMPSGLYEIGAVATVGPVENPCTTKIWGHGYIEEVLLQVYASGQE